MPSSPKLASRPWNCWSGSATSSSIPHDQTCCGQPMANSGFNAEAAETDVVKVVRARTYELVEFLHDILVPMKFIHIAEILNGATV
jgi:hypothetical protein